VRQKSASAGTGCAFGAAAFLFAAARPEAPLLLVGLVLLAIVLAVVSRRSGAQSAWQALAFPVGRAAVAMGVVGLLFGFRKLYFHAWWPNPALMKVGGFNAQDGALYLWDVGLATGAFPLLLFIAGLAVLVVRRLRGAGNATAELVASWGWLSSHSWCRAAATGCKGQDFWRSSCPR